MTKYTEELETVLRRVNEGIQTLLNEGYTVTFTSPETDPHGDRRTRIFASKTTHLRNT